MSEITKEQARAAMQAMFDTSGEEYGQEWTYGGHIHGTMLFRTDQLQDFKMMVTKEIFDALDLEVGFVFVRSTLEVKPNALVRFVRDQVIDRPFTSLPPLRFEKGEQRKVFLSDERVFLITDDGTFQIARNEVFFLKWL